MPAVRKPTAVLSASGAFKNHPSRSRDLEPNSGRGVGPSPAHMGESERKVWDELVGNCAAGVFQSSDRTLLEALSVLVAEFRENYRGFGGRKYDRMTNLLARCGMTPADRSKVTVPRAQPEKQKTGLASFR